MESELISTAARFVNTTNANIFLTGKAGTGKTTFLRDLAQKTHKRFVIVAPTGIAALNASGVTIHSQFLLPLGAFLPTDDPSGSVSDTGAFYTKNTLVRKTPLNTARRQVLRDLDLLIIDEVSMLRADVLDAIDFRLKHTRRNHNQPFGGVQVLMIGDLFQLPPIVRDHEWAVMRQFYKSPWFFDALVLQQSGMVSIELSKVFRQQDDHFVRILNNLRNNTSTTEDIATLNSRYVDKVEREKLGETITLTTHNHKADSMNASALAALATKAFSYKAEIRDDFPESMYPVDETITLKEGAQIMFIKNDTEAKEYFNGKLAKVTRLTPDTITVKMEGARHEYELKKETWENRKYTLDAKTKELEADVIGTFTQFPIRLAWAITVHKSQGLTFDRAVIDVGQAFAPGQVYVALSRLRSLDGLALGTRISPSVISTDHTVATFSQSREQQPPLSDLLTRAQRQYLESLALKTFDFSTITDFLHRLKNDKESTMEFEDAEMRVALDLVREGLESEAANTEKFRHQLLRLLREDDKAPFAERAGKGSSYYVALLWKSLRALHTHRAEVERFSKTKTYVEQLNEVDALMMKKLSEVAAMPYKADCILAGKDIMQQPDFAKKLLDERTTMLDAAVKEAEENPKFTKLKTGRKRKKKDGKKDTPGLKMQKGETYKTTLALINEGHTLDAIAEKRGMAVATIESHAAKLIAGGDVGIEKFLSVDARQEIAKQLALSTDSKPSDVVAHFKGKYTYGQVRMVQAVIGDAAKPSR